MLPMTLSAKKCEACSWMTECSDRFRWRSSEKQAVMWKPRKHVHHNRQQQDGTIEARVTPPVEPLQSFDFLLC